MNGLKDSVAELDAMLKGAAELPQGIDLLVCPPATLVASFAARVAEAQAVLSSTQPRLKWLSWASAPMPMKVANSTSVSTLPPAAAKPRRKARPGLCHCGEVEEETGMRSLRVTPHTPYRGRCGQGATFTLTTGLSSVEFGNKHHL